MNSTMRLEETALRDGIIVTIAHADYVGAKILTLGDTV